MSVSVMYSLAVLLAVSLTATLAFPDGAPSDTCVKKRPNQPNHGQARSQPLDSNPYNVVADSEHYHPGQEVSGEWNPLPIGIGNF